MAVRPVRPEVEDDIEETGQPAQQQADNEVQEQAQEAEPVDDQPAPAPKRGAGRRMVPAEALHEAREEIRRAKAQIEESRRREAMIVQRVQAWQEQQQAAAQAAQAAQQPQTPQAGAERKPLPDITKSPIGYIRALAERQEAQERELAQARREAQESAAAMQQFQQAVQQTNQIKAAVEVDEAQFMQRQPDYPDALDFMQGQWARMIAPSAGNDPRLVQQAVQNWTHHLIAAAQMQGRSPAEVAYETALNMGWRARQPETGKFVPRPQMQPQRQPQPNQRLATIERGQQMSRGAGASGAPGPQFSVENIANMSDAEFDELMRSGKVDLSKLMK